VGCDYATLERHAVRSRLAWLRESQLCSSSSSSRRRTGLTCSRALSCSCLQVQSAGVEGDERGLKSEARCRRCPPEQSVPVDIEVDGIDAMEQNQGRPEEINRLDSVAARDRRVVEGRVGWGSDRLQDGWMQSSGVVLYV